jgi:uncharacterized protein YcbX
VDAVRRHANGARIDERRFRPNFLVAGAGAHEEDGWVGRDVRLGAAVVRVEKLDSRCEMTTHDPGTGLMDVNTLKVIASYRTEHPKKVYFGVYGTVLAEGEVAAGDDVTPLEER